MPKDTEIFEKGMYVTSFLGGVTFAAMILVMQSSSVFTISTGSALVKEAYQQSLISGTAVTSVLFIAASIIMIGPAAGAETNDSLKKDASYLANSGFVGLNILLPLILYAFSVVGAVAVILLEAFILYRIYFGKT